MTYKELVDRIEDTVDRHKMLADFGYGQLSDIKVLDQDGDGADYPYAFLLPNGISRAQQAVTYTFSLIIMEMAITPREILKVQSDCVQYINDIVADLRFDTTFDGDISLTQSVQVFRERFQDEVAGATLNLQVTVADQINACDAPMAVPPVPPNIWRRTSADQVIDYDGFPDGADEFANFQAISTDGINFVDQLNFDTEYGVGYRSIIARETAEHTLEFDMKFKFNEPQDGSGILKYGIRISGVNLIQTFERPWVSSETIETFKATFTAELTQGSEYYFKIYQFYDTPPVPGDVGTQLTGSEVKVYRD